VRKKKGIDSRKAREERKEKALCELGDLSVRKKKK
jgi:hypothetical protein